jgi:hypothetical protein
MIVLVLNLVTYAALAAVMARVAGAGGWTVVDIVLFLCFLVATPWTVLGFWNAAIGLWLLHGGRDGLRQVAPFAAAGERTDPLRLKTAVLMTLRNEDPARAFARLKIVKRSIDETGEGEPFGYFILSDTSSPEVAAAEEAAFAAWRRELADPERVTYRRRETNTGFKAGNVREFCEADGRDYDLMLPLDADSLMTGPAVVRLVRMMQANPKLGILQSLVVGAPASSGFSRIFQFGMRHGMRAYTFGSAWWTAECGPFWGHNAMVRIQPFVEHCRLPILPGGPPLGGHVLSHDQVEATFMRRAGYEVRVLPEENGSFEDNPPTLVQFSIRDLRWCQGNMQYWRLLGLPGLLFMSRFQLAWAILMFLGVPATTLMIGLTPLKFLDGEDLSTFPASLAIGSISPFSVCFWPQSSRASPTSCSRRAALPAMAARCDSSREPHRDRLRLPARGRHHLSHHGLHDRPLVRAVGGVERSGPRRAWPLVGRGGARVLAALRVRMRGLRRARGAVAQDAAVEPAADARLPPRVSVRGPDRPPDLWAFSSNAQTLRYPGGTRSAARDRGLAHRMTAALPKGSAAALARSLRIYHGDHARNRAMDALYGASSSPASLPSTSGPMLATGPPPSAASALASWRSSRSRVRRG